MGRWVPHNKIQHLTTCNLKMKFDLCFTYTYYLYVLQMYFWQTLKFGKICRENVECNFKDV